MTKRRVRIALSWAELRYLCCKEKGALHSDFNKFDQVGMHFFDVSCRLRLWRVQVLEESTCAATRTTPAVRSLGQRAASLVANVGSLGSYHSCFNILNGLVDCSIISWQDRCCIMENHGKSLHSYKHYTRKQLQGQKGQSKLISTLVGLRKKTF